jgi:hypothetical protein
VTSAERLQSVINNTTRLTSIYMTCDTMHHLYIPATSYLQQQQIRRENKERQRRMTLVILQSLAPSTFVTTLLSNHGS